ncbi:MAG: DNA-3-methyladenine glycosylase 2 family protein [Gammaproteobacteria bacterium]|nr:DNA-3-methyladenine glycosylase 2 family protein [Gammaproteobacteria bacterium]
MAGSVMTLTRATLDAATKSLSRRDAGLASIVRRHGAPPLWARRAGFVTLVRIILEQQVSLASAAALHRRLAAQVAGGLSPGSILAIGPAGLRALGVTRQKSAYIHGLAERLEGGRLVLGAVARAPDDDAAAMLMEVPGIGPWTACIYLLMALRRPDIWPPGDLALHKAIARMRGLPQVPTSDQAARLAEAWSPHRAVAARILWHGYLSEKRGQTGVWP